MSQAIGGCVLCGAETEPRVMALVEWAEPIGREQWSHVPRCVDRDACRSRVEVVLREPWPLNDGTPAPVRVGGSISSGDGGGIGPLRSRLPDETGSNISVEDPEPADPVLPWLA